MPAPRRRIVWGRTVVEIWEDCVATHLPGGAVLVSAAETNAAYRETAERLGYGSDTERMCRDHDPAHVALCHLLGLPESPTLRRVALAEGPTELTGKEEEAVLALQAFANAAGVDLLAALGRFARRS